jgi:hypothetical protein
METIASILPSLSVILIWIVVIFNQKQLSKQQKYLYDLSLIVKILVDEAKTRTQTK